VRAANGWANASRLVLSSAVVGGHCTVRIWGGKIPDEVGARPARRPETVLTGARSAEHLGHQATDGQGHADRLVAASAQFVPAPEGTEWVPVGLDGGQADLDAGGGLFCVRMTSRSSVVRTDSSVQTFSKTAVFIVAQVAIVICWPVVSDAG
jgi:hypothetical protein